ncbi:MAG TPA: DegV family protein, partial [Actinomycetota bacterium]
MIGVVTDSAAGLPPELATRMGIEVVPLYLSVDGRSLRDGELPDLYERLERKPGSVTTSMPAPADFEEAFARLPEGELVCVTLAASVSGLHGAARMAAEAGRKRVEVIDSGGASMGEGWVALAAARAAAAGGSLEEVAAAARAAAERTRLVATIDTMEHLRRSGRVGWIAALAATGLQLKPVFEMVRGEIRPVAKPRTRRRALDRVAAEALRDLEGGRA